MKPNFSLLLVVSQHKQPGKRADLTPMEQATIERLQRVSVSVAVVETAHEALKAIGAIA